MPSLEDGGGANVVASFCIMHVKDVPSLEDVAIFCIIRMKYVPSVEDGRGSGKKVATPRTEHLFPTVSSLLQTIHRYSRVSSFEKFFVHPRFFDGIFSNQHLGPPPTSKEERAGKVWLATNTSLLPATIIQVVNM